MTSRSHAELYQKAHQAHVLYAVLLELTYRCNLDCFFCYNDLGLQGQPLSLRQYEDLLVELAELQVLHLSLSGGEPLASPHFWSLGARARELGFVVRVKSNGHALGPRLAARLRDEVDPFVVEVSLHGARADTHDRQTRVRGSFGRLRQNLEAMKAVGLRLRLNATLTAWNEGEVEEMLALADRLRIPLFFDPVVTARDDGDRGPLSISPTDEGVRALLAVLERRRQRQDGPGQVEVEIGRHNDLTPPGERQLPHNCGTGASTVAVDPFGNVYPCVQWRRPLGSLHEQSLREIWSGSPALEQVRAANRQAGERLDALGPEGRQLGFCLGVAEQTSGDPTALYPDAERRLRILRQMASSSHPRLPVLGQG